MDEQIVVENLTVHYDKKPILWNIGFTLPKGKLTCIVGPNGAGKTTLLKSLLGIVKPLSGHIILHGKTHSQMKGRIAYVPQRASIDWDFPIQVFDVVLMGLYGKMGLFQWPSKTDRDLVDQALKQVDMFHARDAQISQLSGGQQQRVFFARALVQKADVYLLDEPFAGIDMATEKALVELLRSLQKQGKTILVVHHDLTTIRDYFQWMILLNSCLVGAGPVETVFNEENIKKAYGNAAYLILQTNKLTQDKSWGDR